MVRHLLALTLLLTAVPGFAGSGTATTADPALFSASGYRIDRYRSPTPETATGATTVSTRQLRQLLDDQRPPVLLDVINLEFRAGRFLQTEPHPSLPTVTWLPNTGRGDLAPEWHRYLLENALDLTNHDRTQPVVVLCKSDCWLSWNAVKRLHEAGFRNLYWYRDGVDSWANAGLPMVPADPVLPAFAVPTRGEPDQPI